MPKSKKNGMCFMYFLKKQNSGLTRAARLTTEATI